MQSKAKRNTKQKQTTDENWSVVNIVFFSWVMFTPTPPPHKPEKNTKSWFLIVLFFLIGFFFVCMWSDFVFNLFSFYRETSYKETIASILCRRCRYHLLYSCRRRYCFIILNNVQRMKMKRNWSLTYRGVRWLWICYLIPSISNSFIFISRF